MIHYAKLEKSDRLKDTLAILSDGFPHSGISIQAETESLAVHTDMAELRANGLNIRQYYNGLTPKGRKKSMYQLVIV